MVGAICALACGNLFAQETEFDLSSQRLEIQQVLPVPGKKIDHHGIVINPTPHELTVGGNGVLNITGVANVAKRKHGNCFLLQT